MRVEDATERRDIDVAVRVQDAAPTARRGFERAERTWGDGWLAAAIAPARLSAAGRWSRLGQTPGDQAVERRRLPRDPRRGRRPTEPVRDPDVRLGSVEGGPPGDQLEEDDAKRVASQALPPGSPSQRSGAM